MFTIDSNDANVHAPSSRRKTRASRWSQLCQLAVFAPQLPRQWCGVGVWCRARFVPCDACAVELTNLECPGACHLCVPSRARACVCVCTRCVRTPVDLRQPFLVLQVNIPPGRPFATEFSVTDSTGTRHRLMFSSAFRVPRRTSLHSQFPLCQVPRYTRHASCVGGIQVLYRHR